MGDKGLFDQVTGKAKEVLGSVTGNKEVELEGVVDQAIGKGKEIISKVSQKEGDLADKVKDGVNEVATEVAKAGKEVLGKISENLGK